jgi:hypothetical protein
MQRKKGSPYSSSRAYLDEECLEQGKALFEKGAAALTFFDEDAQEAHGNVKEGKTVYAVRLDFSSSCLLSDAQCSCKGNIDAPCSHIAALFLELEEKTGGYALGGKEGYADFLKALKGRGFSPLPYLKRALKEFRKRRDNEKWEGKEAVSCLKEAFSINNGYSGFGDGKIGVAMVPLLEELSLSEEEKGILIDEITPLLSSACRKSFFLACFSSPSFSSCTLERFDSGLTNGRSYDLLRLFAGEEDKLLSILPSFTLHLLCQADFRFHAFSSLADELLRRMDKEGIALLAKNVNASLDSASFEALGKRMEEEKEMSIALSCYKRAFGSGGGDFPTLCSYWRGLSEDEKEEKKSELLASLSSSKLLPPFYFLLGKGKQSDISSFYLSDFPCLKEELKGYNYQSELTAKLLAALRKKSLSKEEANAIWDCFAAFPFLSPYLMSEEAKKASLVSCESRARYLSLLKGLSLLEKEGIKEYKEETPCI